MKIAWFCIPAHGHTNPTLGLVKTLTEAGHQIWYFSFEEFREKIESAGATFISCDGYDFEMEDKENADRVGKDKVFATELLVSSTLALDDMTSRVIEEIRPDVVVSDSVAFWGKLAAMKHGLLCFIDHDFRFQSLFGKVHAGERLGHRKDAYGDAAYQQAAETPA